MSGGLHNALKINEEKEDARAVLPRVRNLAGIPKELRPRDC